MCRIAFQTLSYTDMLSNSGKLARRATGASVLASRCFTAAGFTVVQVRLFSSGYLIIIIIIIMQLLTRHMSVGKMTKSQAMLVISHSTNSNCLMAHSVRGIDQVTA